MGTSINRSQFRDLVRDHHIRTDRQDQLRNYPLNVNWEGSGFTSSGLNCYQIGHSVDVNLNVPVDVLFKSELLIIRLDRQLTAGNNPRCAAPPVSLGKQIHRYHAENLSWEARHSENVQLYAAGCLWQSPVILDRGMEGRLSSCERSKLELTVLQDVRKLLKSWSGRPGSNRRRPAWEIDSTLTIKNIGFLFLQ